MREENKIEFVNSECRKCPSLKLNTVGKRGVRIEMKDWQYVCSTGKSLYCPDHIYTNRN